MNLHQSAQGFAATREKLSFMIPEHQSDSDGTGSGKDGSAAFQEDAHFSQHLPFRHISSSEGLRAGTGSHDFGFCLCPTPTKPFLGLTTLALLPLLPPFSDTPPPEPLQHLPATGEYCADWFLSVPHAAFHYELHLANSKTDHILQE